LSNPQNTHLKATLFSDRYSQIFSRHITAAKIYLAYIIYTLIENNITGLKNEQIQDYGLAKFFFTYLIGDILRGDKIGNKILEDPAAYISTKPRLRKIKKAIEKLWKLITPDINAFIGEFTEDHDNFFDYKNVFKNAEFVKNMSRKIKADHEKILIRHPEDAFGKIFSNS
jgi:hypothetical protein